MRSCFRYIPSISFCLFAVYNATPGFATPPRPADIPPGATPKEIEVGDKTAAEIEKDPKTKFLDTSIPANQALVAKLNAMAAELGKASFRPKITYQVKVIQSDDVNAFTVPNGHIYVYKGLIDIAASDDELASVLAHEIGHNACLHALRADKKAKPLNWIGLAAMLGALTGQAGANIAAITPYILTGVMSGYSVEYEEEADHAAIQELNKTQYNPSALVTFMNRLSDEELRRPEVHLGIFQTHPPSPERAAAALQEMKEMGIPYTPRAVTGGAQALVTAPAPDHANVKWNDAVLLDIVTAPNATPTAKTLATTAAARINDLMRANLHLYEISAIGDDTGARITARGKEIIRIAPADAKLQNTTPLALAQKYKENFTRLFWSETVKGNL